MRKAYVVAKCRGAPPPIALAWIDARPAGRWLDRRYRVSSPYIITAAATHAGHRTASGTPGALRSVLRHLSQPAPPHRWSGARHARRLERAGKRHRLGARHRKTSGWRDAAARPAAARSFSMTRSQTVAF